MFKCSSVGPNLNNEYKIALVNTNMDHLNIKNENDHFVSPLCMSDGFKTPALFMMTDLRPPDGSWVPEPTDLRHRVLNSVVSNHLALNLYISIPFKLISHINALSDSRNKAGHNDTPYIVLAPSGEKLHTVQYHSVRNVTVLRLLTLQLAKLGFAEWQK